MEYGVFTSRNLEIAQTRCWALCFYCNQDKSVLGARLYHGTDENKTLAAVCERDLAERSVYYAFELPDGQKYSNQNSINCLLGEPMTYKISSLRKIENIVLAEPYKMPSVSEKGVAACLKMWRMGTSYSYWKNGFQFQIVTNKIEYVFFIKEENCDIYCGASLNIPFDGGMIGSEQYFRFRSFGDNTQPFCRFECNLGHDIITAVSDAGNIVCESGACSITPQGLVWPLKRYSDNEIVLAGCGGDEYQYTRDKNKSEYFMLDTVSAH